MEDQLTLTNLIVLIGSIIGAIKTSKYLNKMIIIDTLIGLFTGLMVGLYFEKEYGILIAGLIALTSGASGAIIIQTFIEMLPKIILKFIKRKLK